MRRREASPLPPVERPNKSLLEPRPPLKPLPRLPQTRVESQLKPSCQILNQCPKLNPNSQIQRQAREFRKVQANEQMNLFA